MLGTNGLEYGYFQALQTQKRRFSSTFYINFALSTEKLN